MNVIKLDYDDIVSKYLSLPNHVSLTVDAKIIGVTRPTLKKILDARQIKILGESKSGPRNPESSTLEVNNPKFDLYSRLNRELADNIKNKLRNVK